MNHLSPSIEIRLVYPCLSSEKIAFSERDIVLEKERQFTSKDELFAYLHGTFRTVSASGLVYKLALRRNDDAMFVVSDVSDALLAQASDFVTQNQAIYPHDVLLQAGKDIIATINATGGIDEYVNGNTELEADPEWFDLCVAVQDLEHALNANGCAVLIKRNNVDTEPDTDDEPCEDDHE